MSDEQERLKGLTSVDGVRRRISLDDPRADPSARELARSAIAFYAREFFERIPARDRKDLTPETCFEIMIRMWECGFLRFATDGICGFGIEPCFPCQAEQLRSPLAQTEQ
jgi:hypothetical protein